jgi:hypothetical protein
MIQKDQQNMFKFASSVSDIEKHKWICLETIFQQDFKPTIILVHNVVHSFASLKTHEEHE